MTAVGIAVGHPGADFEESVALAAAAEAAGLDLVAVGDASADTFALLGAIAARTDRIRLYSSIATWTRTPVTTALASKTVANLAGGRYRLGLGPMPRAWAEDWHGLDYAQPLERMRDFAGALRAAWRADPAAPVDHGGPYFRIRGFPGHPGAWGDEIPLLLAATRPRMATLAGEIADGVIFNAVHSLEWVRNTGRPAVERGLERSGRAAADFEIGILRICGVDDDRARARDLARRGLSFYFGIPYFEEMLREHGFVEELDAGLAALARGDRDGCAAAVSDALVDAMCVAGTPEEVREKVARHEGVVDWIELAGSVGHPPRIAREQLQRIIRTLAAPRTRTARSAERGHARVRRGYVDTAEGQIHYRERGAGEPLLLLHQTASSSVMWERVMRRLPAGLHSIAMDTPGFGASDPPSELPADGLHHYARRVRDFLDALGIERVSVAGHHTGAMIAAEFAAAFPERVDRLALLGCVVIGDEEERRERLEHIDRWQPDARGDFVIRTLIPRMHLSVTTDDPEHLATELTAYLQAGPQYWWAYHAVYTYDAPARLPLVAAPTLCAAGELEPEPLVEWTRAAAELIPAARHVEVPGAGAELVVQQPDVVAELIGDLLLCAGGGGSE